jgi:hypothetical protein
MGCGRTSAAAICRFLRARQHFSGRPRLPLVIVRRDGQADQGVTFWIPLASQLLRYDAMWKRALRAVTGHVRASSALTRLMFAGVLSI